MSYARTRRFQAQSLQEGHRKPILIDTDILSDVDDIGSLAIANVLHNRGLVDLRGVVVNTNSEYGALAASAANTYYGNGDIPIAALRPLTQETFVDTWNFLYTARSWLELILSKVKELVVMGGKYPEGWEFNLGGGDVASALQVVNEWPRDIPVTYSGFELSKDIFSGTRLMEDAPSDSPILAAYEWYVGRCKTARESWDPVTTLYGILGLHGVPEGDPGPLFDYANDVGYNRMLETGSNEWVHDSAVRNQHWLKLADGITNETVAAWLDRLLAHDPVGERCPNHCLHTQKDTKY
ncbi:unnamed protein product [Parascedosporium putredinis]|uniref:Inosine/uridine-preferring nucleoside hydrolase domain-containing protein n=1 Tax=Parascedosporium putredinis TaxID=1442378 RepID=A0A9P1M734_9PEZI|nr:unnamed protein product [Parascedosporium putredinis]CAI7989657.1 unnamed protein product [Parascedosporium putredinis]